MICYHPTNDENGLPLLRQDFPQGGSLRRHLLTEIPALAPDVGGQQKHRSQDAIGRNVACSGRQVQGLVKVGW